MKNLAIIQARMGASRLPGKVLKKLAGKPVLWHVITRVKTSVKIDEVVVATTFKKEDLELVKYCAHMGIRVFMGSENDVLDRFYQVAKLFEPENVVRITADCPLHDGRIIDEVIKKHEQDGNDYTSNTLEETYPDGLDCEIMKFPVLREAWKYADMQSEREHVTQYIIKKEELKKGCLRNIVNKGNQRWTLDTENDYRFITAVYDELYAKNPSFGSAEVYQLLEKKPEIALLNHDSIRNAGLLKSLREDKQVGRLRLDYE
ncbi:MAG: cytidylyltransferase domain-containing protein [Acetivibrio ethanolgignens]